MVMRSKGQLRLLMNANLWPDMKITPMDGGKVRKRRTVQGCSASVKRMGTRVVVSLLHCRCTEA